MRRPFFAFLTKLTGLPSNFDEDPLGEGHPVWGWGYTSRSASQADIHVSLFFWGTVMYLAYFVDRLSQGSRLALQPNAVLKLLRETRGVLVLHPSSLPCSTCTVQPFVLHPIGLSLSRSYLIRSFVPLQSLSKVASSNRISFKLEFNKPGKPLPLPPLYHRHPEHLSPIVTRPCPTIAIAILPERPLGSAALRWRFR